VGFKGFDHALRVGGLVLRSVAFPVAHALEGGDQSVDAGGDGFIARGVGRAAPDRGDDPPPLWPYQWLVETACQPFGAIAMRTSPCNCVPSSSTRMV